MQLRLLGCLVLVALTSFACQAHGAVPRVERLSMSASRSEVEGIGVVSAAMAQLSFGVAPPQTAITADPTRSAPVVRRVAMLPAELVRRTLHAAYGAAGIGASDAQIGSVITRSRLAALLPEVRIRGAQYAGLDSILYDSASTTSATNRDQLRNTRTLEGRATWHLDRLVYGGDEPQLERLRTDRLELRLRIAAKVVEALLLRHRALVDLTTFPADTVEADEAALHLAEAEATLDALTAGAFGRSVSCRDRCP